MSRTQRTVSSTNIYHVMFRGINRQQLFEERQDYERFLFLLEKYKPISGYKIYAYCLMPAWVWHFVESVAVLYIGTMRSIPELGTCFRIAIKVKR